MTNITNSTSVPLPTDPLGSAVVTIFAIIGIVFILGGGVWILLIGIEKIEGHFRRLHDLEQLVWKLDREIGHRKSSVSSETKTVGD